MMHVREMEGNPNYVLLEPVSVDQNMMASLERQMEVFALRLQNLT